MHEGEIVLGDTIIPCYVLEDGTRVLSGRGMQEALKMVDSEENKQTAGTRLQRYLDQKTLEAFIYKDKELDHYKPLECYRGNQKVNGYEATRLADICEAFLEARNAINLSTRQKIIADRCEILIRGFARVGIIALIDEATGYQYDRERFELQKVLAAYVSEEVLKWQKTFDLDFYKEIYRLWGVPFTPPHIRKRPQFIGRLTTKYIYEQLPHGNELTNVLKQKSERKDEGGYKYRFHQSLTPEVGREALKTQISDVITLMKISKTKEEFQEFFNRRFATSYQLSLFDMLEEEPPKQSSFNKNLTKALNYTE